MHFAQIGFLNHYFENFEIVENIGTKVFALQDLGPLSLLLIDFELNVLALS